MRVPDATSRLLKLSWRFLRFIVGTDAAKQHEAGWLIIVFGSKAGRPESIPIDWLIDNYAAGPGQDEAVVNHLVNLTQGWIFHCELTGALTRHGVRPGILLGMPVSTVQVTPLPLLASE